MTGRGATAREDIATLRTIGEVAEHLDLPQHVLRFWETRFKEIDPVKRAGGRRYYRPRDIEVVEAIRHLLYREGYTIKGVQRILGEQGVDSVIEDVRRRRLGLDREPPPPAPPTPPPEPARREPPLARPSLDLPAPEAIAPKAPESPPVYSPPPPIEPALDSPPRAEPALEIPEAPPIAPAPPALRPSAAVIVTRRLDQEQALILRDALAEIEECKRLLNLTRR